MRPTLVIAPLFLLLGLLVALPARGGGEGCDAGPVGVPTTKVLPPTPGPDADPGVPNPPALLRPPFEGEAHFASLRQLTFGGENAEAYWSFDGKRLIFQSTRGRLGADQIFVMNGDGTDLHMVSTGKGRTTCAYFLPGDCDILYASTHLAGDAPPAMPPHDPSAGYVWPVFSSYDIFRAKADGSDLVNLTHSPGYDAEATVSPVGDRIVFTSARDGDLDLYSMNLDGSDVKRLTDAPGYDGGAYYSWDGKKIVWRAQRREGAGIEEAHQLLARQLVQPSHLEIWVMDADGSNKHQVTHNGAANFGPSWYTDNRHVIFASNMDDPQHFNFELYLVDTQTGEIERVTHFARMREGAHYSDDFDGFPMFTPDGKRLAFCSNRFNGAPNETNVFVADWKD